MPPALTATCLRAGEGGPDEVRGRLRCATLQTGRDEQRGYGMRAGDAAQWAAMPEHLREYERARARRHLGEHDVRVEDRADLDALPESAG